jgi:peptidoglycan/LPS O-acetylase OafA/YrhL
MHMTAAHRRSWWRRHSLTLVAGSILLLWVVLYIVSNEHTHMGAFFGNAIADWTGLVVMVLATKHMYEKGSAESKQPPPEILPKPIVSFLRDHSLTIFFVVTGAAWAAVYFRMDSESKWGQVVGNILSEWTQVLGIVLLTKKLTEQGSKESQ